MNFNGWMPWTLSFLVLIAKCPILCGILNSKFQRFDILKSDMMQLKNKRDTTVNSLGAKTLSFYALGRDFVVHLFADSPVIRSGFTVNTEDARGARNPYYVDRNRFYTGFMQGYEDSGADMAYIENIWVGRIFTRETIFSVEPLSLHEAGSHPDYVIVFDNRDVKTESNVSVPFCQEIFFDEEGHMRVKNRTLSSIHRRRSQRRKKRQQRQRYHSNNPSNRVKRTTAHPHDTCDVLAVADYRTMKGIGQGSVHKVVGMLINVYQSVDRVFNQTKFGDLPPTRIIVKSVLVHTEYTKVDPGERHYNMKEETKNAMDMVYTLTNFPAYHHFCVVHLTSQRQYGDTLGLASTAEADGNIWRNGICAGAKGNSRNIGLSTPLTYTGQPMSVSKYMTVVSHELGHNFGSSHDPDQETECSPSSRNGGKYLMWPNSGLSMEANSHKFSPCSIVEVTSVLMLKAHKCFTSFKEDSKVCGNGILEYGEQCDIGLANADKDPCCTRNCRLHGSALCSPYNHPCCTENCKVSPKHQVCEDDSVAQCYKTPFCDGVNHASCPHPDALPNNSSCEEKGTCWYGRCLTFCETQGRRTKPPRHLVPCTCDKDAMAMCRYCCRDMAKPGLCVDMGLTMDDGDPCLLGYCKYGVCHRAKGSDIFVALNAYSNNGFSGISEFTKTIYFIIAFVIFCYLHPCGHSLGSIRK